MIRAAKAAYPTAETMQMPWNMRNSNESGAARAPQTPFQFSRPPEPL